MANFNKLNRFLDSLFFFMNLIVFVYSGNLNDKKFNASS